MKPGGLPEIPVGKLESHSFWKILGSMGFLFWAMQLFCARFLVFPNFPAEVGAFSTIESS